MANVYYLIILFYTVALSGESWNVYDQYCGITAVMAYIAQIKMQNDFKSKTQTLLISS